MRLVVLDTNVIVSAGIKPGGAPATLVMDWVLEGLLQIVTCPSIIEEYRQVAQREKFRPYGFPPLWLEFVIEQSLCLPNPKPWPHPMSDPKDAHFLALAHTAGAWLVTGNLKHFPVPARHRVTVVPPAEYLVHLSDGR
jgi:uncharacterized protein